MEFIFQDGYLGTFTPIMLSIGKCNSEGRPHGMKQMDNYVDRKPSVNFVSNLMLEAVVSDLEIG